MPKQEHISRGNTTCPYGWLTWETHCVLYTQDHQNIDATCQEVDDEFVNVQQFFARLIDVDPNSVADVDVHLTFIMSLAHRTRNMYMCVMSNFVAECRGQQFQCLDKSCIPAAFECNNITDCTDGSDEENCSHVCTQASCEGCAWPQCRCAHGYYQCERGGCIPVDTVCDGTDNCADRSDEAHCELICWPGSSPCSDGLLCVADVHWCDGVQHCPTGSDEQCLAKGCPGLLCNDAKTCIPNSWLNDGVSDCNDNEDEAACLQQIHVHGKCDHGELSCGEYVQHCYSISDHCVYDTDHRGALTPCRTGWHLMDCEHFQCSSTYKCPNAYCIPYGQVCNGQIDCPDQSDEKVCNTTCDGLFCCPRENICLSHHQVCNGKIECLSSADDEKYCTHKVQDSTYMQATHSGDETILMFDYHLQPTHQAVCYAALGISALQNRLLASQQLGIKLVDLSENLLESLPSLVFQQFLQARFMFLQRNKINMIHALAFWGIQDLFVLDLSHNSLSALKLDMFDKCKIANLDLQWNPIASVEFGLFSVVDVVERLFPAFDLMCCMLPQINGSVQCHRFERDDNCTDQLISPVLNYLMWLVCFLCIVLNAALLVKHYKHSNKSTPVLVHVYIADLVTAAYLCILGASSISYRDIFYYHKLSWPSSIPCQIASVLSFISLQISLTLKFVVELQHVCVTAYPFRVIISPRVCTVANTLSWSGWMLFGWLPHILHYFDVWQISLNNMCLYYDLGQLTPWKFMFTGVFMGLNPVLSTCTLVCCFITYKVVLSSSRSTCTAHTNSKHVKRIKKRTLVTGISNVVGCTPAVIIGAVTLCGIAPSELMWTIIATAIIPIFTIINPIALK